MTTPSSWRLDGFGDGIDRWKELAHPSDDIVNRVIRWSLTRLDDPYSGMRREPDFDNLWFGGIPGTIRDNTVVTCSYWIRDRERVVSCNGYGTLSLPI